MTLSGGEATLQMDFSSSLLQALKREGVQTAIETSGFDYPHFKNKLLPWLDLIYYDIKLIDDEASKNTAGSPITVFWTISPACLRMRTFRLFREFLSFQE